MSYKEVQVVESEIVIVLIKSPKKENKIISVQHSIAFIVLRRLRQKPLHKYED